MSFYVNNKYRIKRADNQQDMMQKLLSGNRIFNAYRDILVLSAIVGYCNKAYKPVEKSAGDGVLMQFFTETDYDLMDLLAYAHAKEQAILKEDKKYEIFEAYANAGFPILLKLLEIEPDTEIDAAKQEAILVRLASLLISKQIIIQSN
jgi:dnd system-associated protein 4